MDQTVFSPHPQPSTSGSLPNPDYKLEAHKNTTPEGHSGNSPSSPKPNHTPHLWSQTQSLRGHDPPFGYAHASRASGIGDWSQRLYTGSPMLGDTCRSRLSPLLPTGSGLGHELRLLWWLEGSGSWRNVCIGNVVASCTSKVKG